MDDSFSGEAGALENSGNGRMTMRRGPMTIISSSILAVLLVLSTGCSVTTREIASDESVIYDEGYHFSDKRKIVNDLVESMLTKPPLISADDRPVVIVYGIENRTEEHISTSLISDDIREKLIESRRVRFVNKEQRENIEKETQYQYGGRVASETRLEKARQVGAKYMLTGTLRSIEKKQPKQIRLKKKSLQYYSLHLELTDLETSLVEWAGSAEVIREASKPFIGW
ncbi:MAG: penicillin-binding protein activator LpoB [Proteobacteria bacterium]|nr:penicillin-binding protein activator LpoB [Pseudomonadota bacterium]MBU1687817.1 penicillin-binding protein activator LpoB [Pseudomonadota bacterium]